MVQTPVKPESTTTLNLNVPSDLHLMVTLEQFEVLAVHNRDLRLERTVQGELIVSPPTGWQTGERNSGISGELYLWWRNTGEPGKIFDSSTGFTLPNGANRSPDASWVSQDRWAALTLEQKQRTFAPICPDFVLELRSESDTLKGLQAKMVEYLDNGATLGWLLNPKQRTVSVYRPGEPVDILENPATVSGDMVLAGFVLELSRVWG